MAKKEKKGNKSTKDNNDRQRAMQAAQSRKKNRGSLLDYFKGVRLEMKKVVWPTKKELGSYTSIVLITCGAFAIVFWAIDTGFLAILKGLLGIPME